jgi:virginiamycin B lyase
VEAVRPSEMCDCAGIGTWSSSSPTSVRVGIALVAVLSAVLAASAAGSQPVRPRGAKEFVASAQERDKRALKDLRSPHGLRAALTRVRASKSDLGAALDTVGAAELAVETTSAITTHLMAAVIAKGRALHGPSSRDRLVVAIKVALAHETKAVALLGDAPQPPTIAELPIPLSLFGAFGLALGADGRSVWVSGSDASRILLYPSLDPGTSPLVYRLRPGSFPHGIVVGPDDALYVAETGTNIGGNAIARLTPGGDQREFFLPAGAGGPWGIAVGPDRKIWFTEISSGKFGQLDPTTGKLVEYPLPTANSQPNAIVAGPDGALWGTEAAANRIFRITIDGHATEIPIPTHESLPVSIAPGRGGFLWVSELSAGKLLRISASRRVREFALPAGGHPYGLTSAPDGNVWFADRDGNRIGLVTPAGRIFEYPLPTPNAQPTAIVPLGLGDFAFTERVANRVGRLRFGTG